MNNTEKPFYIETEIPIRTYDIDALNHVNNVVYIRWLEDLRFRMLENHFPYEDLMAKKLSPILTRTEIDYRRAITLFDKVVGSCWVSHVGLVRMTISAEFRVNGEIAASAKQGGLFFDLKSQRPVKIPKEFKAMYDDEILKRKTTEHG